MEILSSSITNKLNENGIMKIKEDISHNTIQIAGFE